MDKIFWLIYLATMIIMSIIAFAIYFKDKKIAVKGNGQMRVKEKTLLLMAVLNGAIGAVIGSKVAHHKTDKVYFTITNYFALIMQVLILVFLFLGSMGMLGR